MIDLLTVEDSLADKPSFRWVIEEQEKDINDLEAILEKVSKGCKTFCDTGKAFCDSMGPFTEGISDLAEHFKADEEIKDAYTTFSEHLEEIKSFYSMLLEQAKRSILSSMIEEMKKMLKEVKLHRKAFKEKSDELDTALNTNSAKIPKKKDDTIDAINSLATLSSIKVEFHHTSVDYVHEINKLQLGKQFLVTDKFLHLMYSFYSFFHQGYLTLQHIDPYLKNLNALMQQKQSQRDESLKKLESRHKKVAELKSNNYDGLMITPKDDSVLLEGYLYKRSHNTFKTWKRRYFMIKENQLHCQKRSKGSKEEDNKIISEDLRISQVKSTEEQDRRYCFELIMPTKKIFLQADSQKVKEAWIKSLQCGIEAAIHNTTSTNEVSAEKSNGIPDENMKSGNSPEILQLLSDIKTMPGNETCVDCASREPVWASINLGVTLCIACSGIHRNLGVHISKVRSIELDIWEHEQCLLMLRLGNSKVNAIYEHSIVEPYRKPGVSSNLTDNELWIRAKYDDKLFLENRDYVKVRLKKRHQSVAAGSYKATSISYDPATITTHHSSLKGRAKRDGAMRPLSKIFQNINRKKRGGSDGAAYIDTEQDPDEDGRALSPQYALLGTEEPNGDGTTHTDTCVPDNLLSNATLSSSSPDLLTDNKDIEDAEVSLNLNLIGPLALNNSLFVSCRTADIDSMYRYISEGADINFRNSTSGDSTPLIQAVHSNSREAVQLLLIHGADVNQIDEKRQTALHHATILGHTDLACLLLKKGADHRRVNTDNKDALDIAVAEERASLVTVLRFIRINDTSDPTSQQLLNEFSKRPAIENKR
ncbi:arf-GAP with coiled-coil, ANK repeat and PH domain-containing protein 2-like [Bolinopsis microptera]|uniref:arf-GAP with coiled-coil, ANK repeat and PH domain-containing protein 2-like n=1 Tax=Bolinopsis microptera TaxID=2820187 RepID=UPI00307A4852